MPATRLVFKSPSGSYVAKSFARWLASFAFLDDGAAAFVQQSHVEDLRRQGVFLRPGDVVIAQGSGPGKIVMRIDYGNPVPVAAGPSDDSR